jgi:hypothetical protein
MRHLYRNFLLSLAVAVIAFVVIGDRLIPSPGLMYAYLYELQPKAPAGLIRLGLASAGLPRPSKSVKQRTEEVNTQLRQMDDDHLRSIANAQRPCASGLINCQGLAELWVQKVAAAEYTERAKKRDQEIANTAAQAAKDNARAQELNAITNQKQLEIGQRNLILAAMSGAVGFGTFVLGVLTWRDRRAETAQAAARATGTTTGNAPQTGAPPNQGP